MVQDNNKLAFVTLTAALGVAYLALRKYQENQANKKKTLLERIGGEAAVDAAVTIFYKKMLSDDRVKRFFEKTNMVHQASKQKNFLLYVLDAGSKRHKYMGLSMDRAHRRLVKEEGLNDMHFDATAENLQNTLKELNVPADVLGEVMTAVASLRDQVLCRGKWAVDEEYDRQLKALSTNATQPAKKTLLDRIGGEPAVDAAVALFYKKMLSDDRVKRFFEKTNMVHQASKQKNFLMYVLDEGHRHKYLGLSMDRAHRRLVKKEGLNDMHFDATAENLMNTLKELGVPKDIIDEVMSAVGSLRDQVLCRGKWAIDDDFDRQMKSFETGKA